MTNESDESHPDEPGAQVERKDQVFGGLIDMAGFDSYLRSRTADEENKYSKVATSPDYPKLLALGLDHFNSVEKFTTGDLIQWKPMMKNKRIPLDAVPAIVVDVIDPPHVTDFEGDRLMEPLDLLIAVVDGDKQFRLAEVSSRRFTAWEA
ncbi:hypothetical protein [Gordonia otitidis]|uniref:Uncharacterized protein n=1 Tax=Gordonia otitidis (strain DSM 44809 / CCUG 52243 / JCM 12355 / NBRC 100426 / IFM 10032) TaxID=1108044 RepID=H5THI7_GORO1|nr:hypothetical protein [Gordonia otitidis]GAB32945.1 hypothetical protein GOOTI_034_00120 [Gordonia otitidis NBRC 100426]